MTTTIEPTSSRARRSAAASATFALLALIAAGCDPSTASKFFGDGGLNSDRPDGGGGINPPPPPANQAAVKFCNPLGTAAGASVEFELLVGSVSLKASTNQCAPAKGVACQNVPAGPQTIKLLRNGTVLWSVEDNIVPGSFLVAETDIDANKKPIVKMPTEHPNAAACAAAGIESDSTPPPPPPPTGGTTLVKLCNAMPKEMPLEAVLVIGGQTFKAAQATCSPAIGTACAGVPAGATTAAISVGGTPIVMGAITLKAGEELIFQVGIDEVTGKPKAAYGTPPPPSTCQSYPR